MNLLVLSLADLRLVLVLLDHAYLPASPLGQLSLKVLRLLIQIVYLAVNLSYLLLLFLQLRHQPVLMVFTVGRGVAPSIAATGAALP